MKKGLLLVFAVLLTTSLLFATGGGQKDSGAVKVGAIHYNQTYEASIKIAEGIRKACKENGFELVEADINGDMTKYQQLVDNLILQKVNAIIDVTWDESAGAMTIQKCKAANIVLVTCDVPYAPDVHMVGAGNYEAGTIIGGYMADYVKKVWGGSTDWLVLVNEVTAGQATIDRLQGSIDALTKAGVKIPANNMSWVDSHGETLLAKQQIADFLTAHPNDRKILIGCLNDDSALGAFSAIQAAGREKDCLIYSYGGESSAAENFKKGDNSWIASVNFSFELYGPLAVDTIKDVRAGKTRPAEQSPELSVLDRANVTKYYP